MATSISVHYNHSFNFNVYQLWQRSFIALVPGGKGPAPEDEMALPFGLVAMPRSSTELDAPLTMPGGRGGSPPPPSRMKAPELPTLGPVLLRLPAGGG